jgi:hypothetical protein
MRVSTAFEFWMTPLLLEEPEAQLAVFLQQYRDLECDRGLQ